VKKWLCAFTVSLCLVIGLTGDIYSIPKVPREPVITGKTKWTTHPVLGIVFLFIVHGIKIQCAHPVFYHAPYPQCKGRVGLVDACMPISYENSILVLISNEDMPHVYGMTAEPSMCLVGHSPFYPVTEKSYSGRR